ncbi:MAG: hypothetical protein EB102_01695, partial [Gammaproteobacteria bacterium]|nr:hypothetical protein [Gammaproteobacteria bacterium]
MSAARHRGQVQGQRFGLAIALDGEARLRGAAQRANELFAVGLIGERRIIDREHEIAGTQAKLRETLR